MAFSGGWVSPYSLWDGFDRYRALNGPILDAMQLLEHAELIRVAWWGESSANAEWSATRLGLATFVRGKGAVRQRIKDRTGL
jgi:hypothetical protein